MLVRHLLQVRLHALVLEKFLWRVLGIEVPLDDFEGFSASRRALCNPRSRRFDRSDCAAICAQFPGIPVGAMRRTWRLLKVLHVGAQARLGAITRQML